MYSLLVHSSWPVAASQPGEAACLVREPGEPVLDLGYRWRPMELTDPTFPACDYLGLPDLEASWVADDRLFLAHGRHYLLVDRKDLRRLSAGRPMRVQLLPVNGVSPYYHCLKFRSGAFFMKRGTQVLRQDPGSGAWEPYFAGSRVFSQFEILPGGRIALVCPRTPPRAPLPIEACWLETVSSGDHEAMPLLECYNREKPGKPDRVVPFPSALSTTLSRVNAYPLIDRTVLLKDQILLINGRAGQVFQLDTRTDSVHLVDVPWQRLDDSFLKVIGRAGVLPREPAGTIQISHCSFPFQIQVYPSSERDVVVAAVRATLEEAYSRKKDEQARLDGNRFFPLGKVFGKGDEWLKFFRYDPDSMAFTELRTAPFRRIKAAMQETWVSPEGVPTPLAALGFEPAP